MINGIQSSKRYAGCHGQALLFNGKDRPDRKITKSHTPALYKNQGHGTFKDVTVSAGLALEMYGMGCIAADYDNDGPARQWIRFELQGVQSNRSAVGARVKMHADNAVQQKLVKASNSYCSQSELVLTFGLGTTRNIDQVDVIWPSGTEATFKDLISNKTYLLVEKEDAKILRD